MSKIILIICSTYILLLDALSIFQSGADITRRTAAEATINSFFIVGCTSCSKAIPAVAYDPDPNPLRESLYFISRVQEATVQQERFINRSTHQQDLRQKMRTTLRLIEKNYKLLDQITYCSTYVAPENLVEAALAGNEAVEKLQNAIDYVNNELKTGPLTTTQKDYLTGELNSAREFLFVFLQFMPRDDLNEARLRVEKENVDNRDEYDGDADAGVYNPVILPWKSREVSK